MTQADLCQFLKKRIKDELTPLIGGRCVLLGVPYYLNIGDVLIWEGTRRFIKENHIQCLGTFSKETFRFPVLADDVTILLQGGGNFGDLWPEEHQFRAKVIQSYPHNRIIVLPQTVYYQNETPMDVDKKLFSRHPDLFLCARDENSFRILTGIVPREQVLLVPDMAFYMTLPQRLGRSEFTLFIRRIDKEYKDIPTSIAFPDKLVTCDWPSMDPQHITFISRVFRFFFAHSSNWPECTDFVARYFFRPYMMGLGIRFISAYKRVFSMRLHGCILSVLLSKPVLLFDNSYGKNRAFFETWLSNVESTNFCSDISACR